MAELKTFEEKKEGLGFCDRQNTIWKIEIADKCNHNWQPLQFAFNTTTNAPNISNGRVYCVCMCCLAHTWVETAYIGYYLNSPDLLENPEK